MLPPSSLKLLYDSFIQPHIHYGLAIWGSCAGKSKQRIISIQKRAIRTITKSYYSSHTEPRMKKIGLLKFDDLYRQQCLLLTHDCVYRKAPSPIQQLVSKKQNSSRHPNDETETRFSKETIGGSRISDFIEPSHNSKKWLSKNLSWIIWKMALFSLEYQKKAIFWQFLWFFANGCNFSSRHTIFS